MRTASDSFIVLQLLAAKESDHGEYRLPLTSCVYPAGAHCPDPYGSVNNCSGSTLTALPYNKNTHHPEQFSGSAVFQIHFIIIRKCEQHQNQMWHMWRLLASTGLLISSIDYRKTQKKMEPTARSAAGSGPLNLLFSIFFMRFSCWMEPIWALLPESLHRILLFFCEDGALWRFFLKSPSDATIFL